MSKLPTVDQFLTQTTQRNSYITHPEFASLYIRYTEYAWALNNNLYRARCIQLVNFSAKKPGNGAFKRLLLHIILTYKKVPIIVECVHNKQFANGLLKMGFTQFTLDPSFIINHRHIEPLREGIKPGYTLSDSLVEKDPLP